MGKGALRPFFKGHSLKKEKEHEKKEVDKMLLHFVTLPAAGNMRQKDPVHSGISPDGRHSGTLSARPTGSLACWPLI